jgi:hypothetical protein
MATADRADGVQAVSSLQDQDGDSDFEVEEPGWLSEQGASETSPLFPGGSRGPSPKLRAPKDHYRLVWIVFYLLGMTTLLPWNFFIAVNDYWNFKVARWLELEWVWRVSHHSCSSATPHTTARSTPSFRRSSHPTSPSPPMLQMPSSSF